MTMDYLKEGENVTLKDGTFVEKNEKGIIVHNVPSSKGIFKDIVLETWIDALLRNKDAVVKDMSGEDHQASDSIKIRIIGTCSSQWGVSPEKIAEALEIIYAPEEECFEELSSDSDSDSDDIDDS